MLLVVFLTMWWYDVVRERTFEGIHTTIVQRGLRMGMLLFILSEVMFFLSFFWAFFHRRYAPTFQIRCLWPPLGIELIIPFRFPLFNTVLLLARGVTITWAHREIMNNNDSQAVLGVICTLIYGLIFTLTQLMEYKTSWFTIADGIYGAMFYIATGFHGFHVIVGSIFIFICLGRLILNHLVPFHHVGFEAASWYWHFVDVVWICLYLCVYCWGSL